MVKNALARGNLGPGRTELKKGGLNELFTGPSPLGRAKKER